MGTTNLPGPEMSRYTRVNIRFLNATSELSQDEIENATIVVSSAVNDASEVTYEVEHSNSFDKNNKNSSTLKDDIH